MLFELHARKIDQIGCHAASKPTNVDRSGFKFSMFSCLQMDKYLSVAKRMELSKSLDLTEVQIKVQQGAPREKALD